MRTLERNKIDLWKVSFLGEIEIKDDEDYFTGEIEKVYTEPVKIRLPLYPASGAIKERMFGKDADINMISVSTEKLDKNDLLFHEEPVDNYELNYDYSVNIILPSLNSYNYGLKRRI